MTIASGIDRIWKTERFRVRWLRLLSKIIELCAGRLNAWMVGWPQGFIGDYSRIIGTAFIEVEPKCSIGRFSWIEVIKSSADSEPILKIGERFSASERLHIACENKVEIGDNCLVGSGVHITDHNHGVYNGGNQSHPSIPPIDREIRSSGPVVIGSNVWIGDNVVIIGPVMIGEGVVVGANSVITKDIPDGCIAVGSPAIPIKHFDQNHLKWVRAPR